MDSNNVKVRFCPSPTGHMHLGNGRTAFFNALYAGHSGGVFLLRIEDTDQTRSKPEFVEQLQADLRWMGLPWQEGATVGGDNGPYFQSERAVIYDDYYEKLASQDLAYPCFCSEQQLAISRKLQRAAGQPPRYSGTCRSLSSSEIAKKLEEGLKPTLRFRIPENEVIEFTDWVKGPQRFLSEDIGDFIIRRADGTASFMYCNAIDDALMGVTHVLRGEDHLTNTPRQLMILKALGLPAFQYAHFSLIVGSDGSPLSKRHGSQSILQLRQAGYLPDAISNYLGRLGHVYESNDWMSIDELAKNFDMEKLSSSPARFDLAQLQYWQKESIKRLGEEQAWEWLGSELQASILEDKRAAFLDLVKPNVVFPVDAETWANVILADALDYDDDALEIISSAGVEFFQTALSAFEEKGLDLKAVTQTLKEQLSVKGKGLFQPLRVGLTGQLHGPDLPPVLDLMGAEQVIKRLNSVIEKS